MFIGDIMLWSMLFVLSGVLQMHSANVDFMFDGYFSAQENSRLSGDNLSVYSVSLVNCVLLCNMVVDCEGINHFSANKTCEMLLADVGEPIDNSTGWRYVILRNQPQFHAGRDGTKTTLNSADSTLNDTEITLHTTQSTLNTTKNTLDTSVTTWDTTDLMLDTTNSTLDTTEQTLDTTESTFDTTDKTLDTSVTTWDTIDFTLDTTDSTLDTIESTLDTTEKTLDTTESNLDTTKSMLDKTETTLDTTERASSTTTKTPARTTQTPTTIKNCPSGFQQFGNGCYYIQKEKTLVSLTSARTTCSSKNGAKLSSVETMEEYTLLFNYLVSINASIAGQCKNGWMLDAERLNSNKPFYWGVGDLLPSIGPMWAPGQPQTQQCVAFYPPTLMLNDIFCEDYEQQFICEL